MKGNGRQSRKNSIFYNLKDLSSNPESASSLAVSLFLRSLTSLWLCFHICKWLKRLLGGFTELMMQRRHDGTLHMPVVSTRVLPRHKAMPLGHLDLSSPAALNSCIVSFPAMPFYTYMKHVLYQPVNSNPVCPDEMTVLYLPLLTPSLCHPTHRRTMIFVGSFSVCAI